MWAPYKDRPIYLDSNIIIYAMEESSMSPEVTRALLKAVDAGEIRAATSELTLAEVMSKPLQLGNPEHIAKYEQFFSPSSALLMLQVSREVLTLSARLRAFLGLKLIDAIHVATARLAGCEFFLTQDERLGRALAGQPKWLRLDELS